MRKRNPLFPVFLKLEDLHTLIVGGGSVGYEKLSALLRNSPGAQITVVAPRISNKVRTAARKSGQVTIVRRPFEIGDLHGKDLVFLACNDRILSARIRRAARKRKLLVNVADTPELCDFYLGSVVTKGDLKIGISTNGKSPTVSKRFRQYLQQAIPGNLQQLLDNMETIRKRIQGDFARKVKTLNKVTEKWLNG